MTKNEVMQMALDVFTNKRYARASAVRSASVVSLIDALALAKVTEANKELRTALAQPEPEPEPVAWRFYVGNMCCYVDHLTNLPQDKFEPLYTAPPPPRKQLSDEELLAALKSVDSETARLPNGFKLFARAIEAAHGIKEK